MTGYKLTRKNTLAICASAMVLSLVATTQAWSAPATLNDAVTLNEVRTDAKTPVETDPQTQRDEYQYQINGKDVIDTSKDIAKGDFDYLDKNGDRTNLGANDNPDYILSASNGKDYDAAEGDKILKSDYTVSTSKGNSKLDEIKTDTDGNLSKDGYTYNGISLETSVLDRIDSGAYTYTDKNGKEYALQVVQDASGNYIGVIPKDLVSDSVAVTNANQAYGKFTQDQTAYNGIYETWSNDNDSYHNTLNNYNKDVDTLGKYEDNYKTFADASTQYGEFAADETKYVNYTGSLGGIIDNRAETIAKQTVKDNTDAIADNKTAIKDNADAIDVLNGDVDTAGSVKHTVYNEAQTGMYDGEKVTDSNATTLGAALSDTAVSVNKNTAAIDVLNDDVNTEGSVKHTVYNNAENGKYTGYQVNNGSEDRTIGEVLADTNRQVDTNTANIETNKQNIAENKAAIGILNEDVNTEGSVKHTVFNEAQNGMYEGQTLNGSDATTLGGALSDTIGQVNTLNGDVNMAGSVQHTVYNNAENAVYSGTQVTGTSTRATATLGSALSATTEQVNINTDRIAKNTASIETNRQNIASNLARIETNSQSISDLRSDFNAQNVRNEARFSKVEKKIEEVSDEMNKGLASTAALTSLVPLSSRHRTQLSLGMGGYRDKQAIAAGGYHYVAGNVLLNAGVAWGGDNSVSYKAGVTYGF